MSFTSVQMEANNCKTLPFRLSSILRSSCVDWIYFYIFQVSSVRTSSHQVCNSQNNSILLVSAKIHVYKYFINNNRKRGITTGHLYLGQVKREVDE